MLVTALYLRVNGVLSSHVCELSQMLPIALFTAVYTRELEKSSLEVTTLDLSLHPPLVEAFFVSLLWVETSTAVTEQRREMPGMLYLEKQGSL